MPKRSETISRLGANERRRSALSAAQTQPKGIFPVTKISRRQLLRQTALTGSAALVSWLSPQANVAQAAEPAANTRAHEDFRYLTSLEVAFVDAAAARLIPSDELGPGAREAHVPLFIDHQLAGPYGHAERWYMQGPWATGTKEQGYQLKFSPAQLYRAAIADIDNYCRRTLGQHPFAELDAAAQDNVLQGLESGQIELSAAPSKEFFTMLLQNTIEGFLSDPMYGGNRNFIGWKLVGFPGPRYNYVEEIGHFGQRYSEPTVGLMGRDGSIWMRKG